MTVRERPLDSPPEQDERALRLELEELQVAVRKLEAELAEPARPLGASPALLELRQQAADAQRAHDREKAAVADAERVRDEVLMDLRALEREIERERLRTGTVYRQLEEEPGAQLAARRWHSGRALPSSVWWLLGAALAGLGYLASLLGRS